MSTDKTFLIAFVLSAIGHGVILLQNPNLNLSILPKEKKDTILEVSYLKALQLPKEETREETPKKEPFLKLSSRITAAKMSPPPFIDRESIFKKNKEIVSQKYVFTKPALPSFEKPDIIAIKKKKKKKPVDLDKIDNPSYISYYQIVREKIRRMAYQNYTSAEVGEVFLSFLIFADGSLKAVRLTEEKSSPSPYLREIALRSIKEAAPFPAFPKELDYPQLSFNVVISFEIE